MPDSPPATPAALGWRLLAMAYDALPLVPVAFAVSAAFLLAHRGALSTTPAWAAAQWLTLWLACGAYFVGSWRRGGQTLGMRPWRLRVVNADGSPAGTRALVLRYAVATLSLAALGLGFAWSLVDRERRAWHDRASGTALVRLAAA